MSRHGRTIIHLAMADGNRWPTEAIVFGRWAAHRVPMSLDRWRVSDTIDGRSIAKLVDDLDERDAVAIARRMHAARFDPDGPLDPDLKYIAHALVAEALDTEVPSMPRAKRGR